MTAPAPAKANEGAGLVAATVTIAGRAVKKVLRTPQLIVAGTLQGLMFLVIFRYVFGGAISHTGGLSYVDFVVPGFVTTTVLFGGMGSAIAIAEDLHEGLIDRLRSLPAPSLAIVCGRVLGDMALTTWSLAVTSAIGFAVGFRLHASVGQAFLAFVLCILFGFALSWLFVALGFVAGSPQAAQSTAFLVFPFTFVSSAFVPVATMPTWMRGFAAHQPVTEMVNTVRVLTEGRAAAAVLGHTVGAYLPFALGWSVAIVVVCAPFAISRLRRG
ncbi:MAG TPA: ABC transporter permease [Acidimicrobiales bacterium]|nr:ABC transporter permease [Acidimicrobiales bacterium]